MGTTSHGNSLQLSGLSLCGRQHPLSVNAGQPSRSNIHPLFIQTGLYSRTLSLPTTLHRWMYSSVVREGRVQHLFSQALHRSSRSMIMWLLGCRARRHRPHSCQLQHYLSLPCRCQCVRGIQSGWAFGKHMLHSLQQSPS